MQNNVYKFQPDQPTLVCLKYRNGKPFTWRGTTGFSYTMGNGLTVRFPEEAHKGIQALHLDAGQPFRVTKRTTGPNAFAWDIERIPSGPVSQENSNRPGVDTLATRSCQSARLLDDTIPPAILTTNHGRDVLMHLIGAIEIANAAENYAKNHLGRIMRFTSNDIRALAISCFIQQGHELAGVEPMVSPVWLTTSPDRLRVSGSAAR